MSDPATEGTALYQRRYRAREFETAVPWLALIEAMRADAQAPDPVTDPCPCSTCSEPVEVWDADLGGKRVMNDLHDKLRPCEECGRAKTEHIDHGNWGEYGCWWCNERTADTRVLA